MFGLSGLNTGIKVQPPFFSSQSLPRNYQDKKQKCNLCIWQNEEIAKTLMGVLPEAEEASSGVADFRENTQGCRCKTALGRTLCWGLGYTLRVRQCTSTIVAKDMGRWEVGCFLDPRGVWGETGRGLNKESLRWAIFVESNLYSWEEHLAGAGAREGSVPCEGPFSCPCLLTLEKSTLKEVPNGGRKNPFQL